MKPLNLHQKEKLKEERRRKDEEEAKKLYEDFAQSFGSEERNELVDRRQTHDNDRDSVSSGPYTMSETPIGEINVTKKSLLKRNDVFSDELDDDDTNTRSDEPTETHYSSRTRISEEQAQKRKRNLDSFLEEIKREHDEKTIKQRITVDSRETISHRGPFSRESVVDEGPTTNIYVTGLPTNMNEEELGRRFALYGPVASVKILWPRSEEERLRGKNCGFVSFMDRGHAEDALRHLNGVVWTGGHEIRLCWGKAIPIPSRPYYVHPDWRESDERNSSPRRERSLRIEDTHHLPSRSSSSKSTRSRNTSYISAGDYSDTSENASDHSTEFHGNDKRLHRNSDDDASLEEYSSGGHSSDLSESEERDDEIVKKGRLTRKQTHRWEKLLRKLTCERDAIAQAMYFAINHSDAADEVSDILLEFLNRASLSFQEKLAYLYLLSDILHNSCASIPQAWKYRTLFESRLVNLFETLSKDYKQIPSVLKSEQVKRYVTSLIKVWESWLVYPQPLINQLIGFFARKEILSKHEPENTLSQHPEEDEDIDGIPVTLDSVSSSWKGPIDLQTSSLLTPGHEEHHDRFRSPAVYPDNEDIDGIPI